MLHHDLQLYARHTELQEEWQSFCDRRPHLLSSFPPPQLDPSSEEWAGGWRLGSVFEASHLNLLAPLEVREHPILVIRDDSPLNTLTLSMDSLRYNVLYIPPARESQPRSPIILRNKASHFTVLQPVAPCDSRSVLRALLPMLDPYNYIDKSFCSQCRMVDLLSVSKLAAEADDARVAHSILLRGLSDAFERTPSQTMANIHPHAALQLLDAETADAGVVDCDLLTADANVPRPSSPSQTSPSKAPLVATTPPRGQPSGHTPRTGPLFSAASSPEAADAHDVRTLSSQASGISISSSGITDVSNVDLAAYVRMSCGKNESRYARGMDVVGAASSDETSEVTGPSWKSSDGTLSSSQTPSIFSTGSAHIHATPSDFVHPLCQRNHSTDFVQFHSANHTCDWPDCRSPAIPRAAFGWHCPACSFDICVHCWPITFSPVSSQITMASDSDHTLQLDSPAPSQPSQAAPRLQESADAAALSRGHDA